MTKRVLGIVLACLLVFPAAASAFDYKTWVSALPKALGTMKASGEPDGMNMDMGGQKWSSLNQTYQSRDGARTAQLSVVAGQMAPQVQGFQSMSAMNMNMEAGGVVMKTVNISGKRCMVNLDKKAKTGTVMIPLKKDMLVSLVLEPATSTSQLTALAREIPLARFKYGR